MRNYLSLLVAVVATALLAACSTAAPSASGKPEFMLVGVDTKAVFADDGALNNVAPGKDVVTIVDIGTDPAHPRIVASLPLMNSIFGPPTNLAVTPDGTLGSGGELDGLDARWRELESRPRQQALCHRPDHQSAQADRHGGSGQAAVRACRSTAPATSR